MSTITLSTQRDIGIIQDSRRTILYVSIFAKKKLWYHKFCVYNRDPDTVANEAYNVVKAESRAESESEYEIISNIPPPTSPTTQSTAGDYEQV